MRFALNLLHGVIDDKFLEILIFNWDHMSQCENMI